ncbi:MAG: DUF3037 domain-containing protein [Planctomycetaceae bacterium]|nr:DUF3037 domain-containing protein [Planctomycetaceae bacterium]
MNSNVGYYSLVQYQPDPVRLEAANIGVLLFCPAKRFLRAKTARDNDRIRHFFGSKGHDWRRIDAFKRGLEERVQRESETIQTEEQLRRFIEARANEIRISAPRYIRVSDCEQQLDELFAELIGDERMVAYTSAPAMQPEAMLLRKIQQSGLERKIEQDVVIEVPFVKRKRLTFPLAYQNDRFHVLRSEKFHGAGRADPAKKAYRHAVEGRFLFEHPDRKLGDLQLVVVGEFADVDQPQIEALRDLLADNRTTLYTTKELPKLVDEIRTHAKDLR